jgi:O-antigen/teichoic acid export membrane protein
MADPTTIRTELLANAPAELRRSIVSGMRWTLWLSVLSVPFSYGTSFFLARTGPEVIGTFGLLSLYIQIVSTLFYLGGDAVLIRFLPEIDPPRRFSFFLSYLLVTLLAVAPWIALGFCWPRILHYLFGNAGGKSLQMTLVCLAPVLILYSAANATLRAQLQIGLAQWIARTITVGSFMIYAVLFFTARTWLRIHSGGLIWFVYFGLLILALAWEVWSLYRSSLVRERARPVQFQLPRGFWPFTLALEGSSALGAMQRLDYVMILNFGGLLLLGKYVAAMTLATSLSLIVRFFLDPLMPTLTNLVARREWQATEEILTTFLRILCWAAFGVASLLMLCAHPLLAILGRDYHGLDELLIVMIVFASLLALASFFGSLLTSFGRQFHLLWAGIVQLGLFIVLFFLLWNRIGLMGVALALAISQLLAVCLLLWIVHRTVFVSFLRFQNAGVYVLAIFSCAVLAHYLLAAPLYKSIGVAAVVNYVFLLLSGYSAKECRKLISCFVPLFGSSDVISASESRYDEKAN